jgi:T-complex protein 1 subunit beta
LEHIQIIKKVGGQLNDSFLAEGVQFALLSHISAGFILDKKLGVNAPRRIEKAKILIANTRPILFWSSVLTLAFTAMDTDKIKIFGARVRVDDSGKLAELERAERVQFIIILR